VFVSAIAVPVLGFGRRFGSALIASSAMIAGMMGLSALSLFPRLVPSSKSLESSLTAFGHSSSQHTLGVMLIIALIGMPFVIGYTAFIYRVFKGQIEVQSDGY
jgi:cytochrome d ubiquinol oxidase subunit II